MLEEKAKELAIKSHEGQFRKDGITPYVSHPEAVVAILKEIGIINEDILCAGWLHDTIEECELSKETIEIEFNSNVAKIVYQLTRNVNREDYKTRMGHADYAVQIVKLADTLHNCLTLYESLPEKTIRRKIEDCNSFYLPLAEKICPEIYTRLVESLRRWSS